MFSGRSLISLQYLTRQSHYRGSLIIGLIMGWFHHGEVLSLDVIVTYFFIFIICQVRVGGRMVGWSHYGAVLSLGCLIMGWSHLWAAMAGWSHHGTV